MRSLAACSQARAWAFQPPTYLKWRLHVGKPGQRISGISVLDQLRGNTNKCYFAMPYVANLTVASRFL